MSLIPTLFAECAGDDGDIVGKHPIVRIKGDPALAQQRRSQFAHAYTVFVNSTKRNTPSAAPVRKITFPTGDSMHIVSQNGVDYVTLTVVGVIPPEDDRLRGFLVTPLAKDGKNPDRDNAVIYSFDFDATEFASRPAPGKQAGNLRRKAGGGKYVSWNSTGGGELAIEEEFTRSSAVTAAEEAETKAKTKAWADALAKADPELLDQVQVVSTSPAVIAARTELERAKIAAHTARQTALMNPNMFANPFDSLSGDLYSNGVKHHVLDGLIYGMRARGNTIIIAEYVDDRTVRFHKVLISRDEKQGIRKLRYDNVMGTAQVPQKGLVNFNEDLSSCVILSAVVEIKEPFSAGKVFKVTPTIEFDANNAEGNKIVRAGYKGSDLSFTMTTTLRAGGMTNFCPHDFEEYALPWDDNPAPIDTYGHRTEERNYFDVKYKQGWSIADIDPNWVRKYDQARHCVVIKKPIIVFRGYMPTTAYTWMRTVSQLKTTDENILYWYKDYGTDDYVRSNWFIGYVATQNYEQYGAFEPDESDVVTGRAISVGGTEIERDDKGEVVLDSAGNPKLKKWANVIPHGVAAGSNWFYAVTNSQGDFILRGAPNGKKADALLISRKGAVKRIKDTYSVGII